MGAIVVGSTRHDAGKTSLITGMGMNLDVKVGYMKPLGDRLFYRKKRLWDYDSAIVTDVFDLKEIPEEMSIGFEHTKIRFMYDDEGITEKVRELYEMTGSGKDLVFVESGPHLGYGLSVHLDAISIARILKAPLLLVISGDDNTVNDDISFVQSRLRTEDIDVWFVLNKVTDVKDFEDIYMDELKRSGARILGSIPYVRELTFLKVGYLNDRLFGRVIAGQSGLDRTVKSVFVGAMSADQALREAEFNRPGKLIITSGDRTDMILAALKTDSAAVVLTNDRLPNTSILSKADEMGTPLIMVPSNTFETAKRITSMEPLLVRGDQERPALLKELIKKNMDMDALKRLIG